MRQLDREGQISQVNEKQKSRKKVSRTKEEDYKIRNYIREDSVREFCIWNKQTDTKKKEK